MLFGIVFLLCIASVMAISHNATSITLTEGTYISGNVTSTYISGDVGANNTYNWSGVNSIPGFDIRFNTSDITADRVSYAISLKGVGTPDEHIVHIDVYNFTGDIWDTIGTTTELSTWVWANVTVYSQDYLSSNEMWVRVYHANRGTVEDFAIDYFQIIESDAITPIEIEYGNYECPLNTIQSTMLYMFIGCLIIGFAAWASYTTILFFSIIVGLVGMVYAFPLYSCNPVYGLVVTLAALFYIVYEAFARKFQEVNDKKGGGK